MKTMNNLARYALGLLFLVFGLNKFFWFLPMPVPPEAAQAFFGALMKTGYFIPFLAGVYLISSALLLANIWVPLALLFLIAPIVQIQLYHIFLDPAGLPLGLVVLALELFLAWGYRDSFKTLLIRDHSPRGE